MVLRKSDILAVPGGTSVRVVVSIDVVVANKEDILVNVCRRYCFGFTDVFTKTIIETCSVDGSGG